MIFDKDTPIYTTNSTIVFDKNYSGANRPLHRHTETTACEMDQTVHKTDRAIHQTAIVKYWWSHFICLGSTPKTHNRMKKLLLVLAVTSAGLVNAQVSRWSDVLRTDPYLSNGYFIINPTKYQSLDLDHINIDMILATPNTSGGITKQTIQSFSITNGFQGHADMAFLQTLQSDQRVYYRLRGYTDTGSVPIDFEGLEVGGQSLPRVCGQTCLSTNYSWTIDVYASGGEAIMEMRDGTVNGSYDYFYIKDANWPQFTQQYTSTTFGMHDGGSWSDILDLNLTTEVVHLPVSAPDFRNEVGVPFGTGYSGPAYAVAKHAWPWEGPVLQSNVLINNSGVWCSEGGSDIIRSLFNADGAVQNSLAQYGLSPIACNALPGPWGGITWGGSFTSCTSVTTLESVVDENGNIDVMNWVTELVDCATGSNGTYLWDDVLMVMGGPY
jgi:hypothetical protein